MEAEDAYREVEEGDRVEIAIMRRYDPTHGETGEVTDAGDGVVIELDEPVRVPGSDETTTLELEIDVSASSGEEQGVTLYDDEGVVVGRSQVIRMLDE
ncbi:hypothetical protein [Halomicrobium sp. LC1Hm]|uniref:hypothetical protein n=1 Tax=Halomicrobium sp. LC1Hm TaxID=2610902 RepID=UPI0012982AE8|nr:hypothetical protein [Halomicrobium sp. LC1Hm]QGA81990.1 hypothetical protein LC1Hm_0928 [Halomicrobium sp. LC1Hm]